MAADRNPVSFLLNRGQDAQDSTVVEAPAFSLTKVLSTLAVILTPLATLLVKAINDVHFSASNYTVLIVAVLGFLAIAASADVLGRSIATSAEKNAQAAEKNAEVAVASLGQFVPFPPLSARRISTSDTALDPDIKVLGAAQAHEPFYLVKDGDSTKWEPAAKIKILEKDGSA
jgi:hypothetical protein